MHRGYKPRSVQHSFHAWPLTCCRSDRSDLAPLGSMSPSVKCGTGSPSSSLLSIIILSHLRRCCFYGLQKYSKLSPDGSGKLSGSELTDISNNSAPLMSSPSVYQAVLLTGSHLILTIKCFKDEDLRGSELAPLHKSRNRSRTQVF